MCVFQLIVIVLKGSVSITILCKQHNLPLTNINKTKQNKVNINIYVKGFQEFTKLMGKQVWKKEHEAIRGCSCKDRTPVISSLNHSPPYSKFQKRESDKADPIPTHPWLGSSWVLQEKEWSGSRRGSAVRKRMFSDPFDF